MSFKVGYTVYTCQDCPKFSGFDGYNSCTHSEGPDHVDMNYKYEDFYSFESIHPECPLNAEETK